VLWLRLYLLSGLIAHKVVWEVLKRRAPGGAAAPKPTAPPHVRAVKAAKVAVLAGIAVQTMLPTFMPVFPDGSPNAFTLQAAGVVLYTLGLALAVGSRLQLGSNWSDIESARVLDQQVVVERGIYGLIRHPIYVGDVLLLWGLELALNSWLVAAVAVLTPVVLVKAIREERMLARSLPGYSEYCARTKRFIPFLI
jgi:protein-S-isoprenylcysteine O-methyltransferase Ste14